MSSNKYARAGARLALIAALSPSATQVALAAPLDSFAPVAAPAASAGAMSQARDAELALRYAPVHYQSVNPEGRHALGGAADYITGIDFDGDWDGRNNWQNAAAFPLAAKAYYSVVETPSHFFLVYLYFHPRDWSSTFFETEHENDAEGVLLTVHKDGSEFGELKSAVTIAHSDFYSYVAPGSGWRSGIESVDGELRLVTFEGRAHPVTIQQAETHAMKAWPAYTLGKTGVVYYPSLTRADEPKGPNDRHVSYQLVDIFEPGGLWDHRRDPELFAHYGAFAGDGSDGCGDGAFLCLKNAAHAPWAWDDHDDVLAAGTLTLDPARLVSRYFKTNEAVSQHYAVNPYRASGDRERQPQLRDPELTAAASFDRSHHND